MSHRYYSTNRPVSIGTYPRPAGNEVLEILNFEQRRSVPEIGRQAWGWVEYASPLSASDAENYELVSVQTLPPYVAVGAGYSYNVFPLEVIEGVGVALERTGLMLLDEGESFELYKAATFDGSQKIDLMLDAYGEKPVVDAVKAFRASTASAL